MHLPSFATPQTVELNISHPTKKHDWGRYALLGLGTIILWYGCSMSYAFGKTTSEEHAVILGSLAIVCAFLPERIDALYHIGRRNIANWLFGFFILLIAVEYFSHIGYTMGHRMAALKEHDFHNETKLPKKQELASSAEAGLEAWIKRQGELKQERDSVVSADQSLLAVTSASLKGDLDAAQKAIELEAKRGGCKTKCQKLMVDKANIEKRIGSAERLERMAADLKELDRKIAESQSVKLAAVDDVLKTGVDVNKNALQTEFVSQLATRDLKPSIEAKTWTNIVIGALVSLITTFLAPLCFFLANAGNRTAAVVGSSGMIHQQEPAAAVEGASLQQPQPYASTTINVAGDDLARQISELCRTRMSKAA